MQKYTDRPKGSGRYIFEHDLPIVKAFVEALGMTEELNPRMNGHGIIEIQIGNNFYFGGKAIYLLSRYARHSEDCPEREAFIELAKDYSVTIK